MLTLLPHLTTVSRHCPVPESPEMKIFQDDKPSAADRQGCRLVSRTISKAVCVPFGVAWPQGWFSGSGWLGATKLSAGTAGGENNPMTGSPQPLGHLAPSQDCTNSTAGGIYPLPRVTEEAAAPLVLLLLPQQWRPCCPAQSSDWTGVMLHLAVQYLGVSTPLRCRAGRH